MNTVLSFEPVNSSFGCFFHILSAFIDLRACHIVGFTVIPNQVYICEHFLISDVFAFSQIFLVWVRFVENTLIVAKSMGLLTIWG